MEVGQQPCTALNCELITTSEYIFKQHRLSLLLINLRYAKLVDEDGQYPKVLRNDVSHGEILEQLLNEFLLIAIRVEAIAHN